MMIELDLDKKTTFTLEMKIDGDVNDSRKPEMRFSVTAEEFTISIPATRVDNGIYEVAFPSLKGILKSGEYDVKVEVLIGDKHFVPLTDKIRLKEEIKPTVKLAASKEKKDEGVKVAVAVSKVEETKRPTITKTDQILSI